MYTAKDEKRPTNCCDSGGSAMSRETSIVTITLNPAVDRTLWIDGFAIGKVNRVTAEESHPAGKGVNVATMLADLEADVSGTGFLGTGNAKAFEKLFEAKGIEDRFVRIPGETRVGLKIVDQGQTTDINFAGFSPSREAVGSLFDQITQLVLPGRWFVLCGSVPAGVATDIYAQLVDQIHAGGGRVLLDTSGTPLGPALMRTPDVVKPNIAELSELAGRDIRDVQQTIEVARQLFIEKGVTLAVVSMGGEGAVFVDRDQSLLAVPPAVAVRSTVGAGDAMVAGIVLGQSRGWPLVQTAALASSLGTYAVTRIGTGLESREAYKAFPPTIRSL